MSTQQPQWQTIDMLPVFTDMIDGMLEDSTVQLVAMRQVEQKPHVLDDATLDRVKKLYGRQLEDHWFFEEQFIRWQKEDLKDAVKAEIARLSQQALKLKSANEQILNIARTIEHSTIDKIMAMGDGELAFAMLTGKIKPPR